MFMVTRCVCHQMWNDSSAHAHTHIRDTGSKVIEFLLRMQPYKKLSLKGVCHIGACSADWAAGWLAVTCMCAKTTCLPMQSARRVNCWCSPFKQTFKHYCSKWSCFAVQLTSCELPKCFTSLKLTIQFP